MRLLDGGQPWRGVASRTFCNIDRAVFLLATIALAEIDHGQARLPEGRRHLELKAS